MKILVTYFSQTGNTKKVAEAIYGEIEGDKELKEFPEVESLEGYNITFVGFPMQAFGPAQQAKDFLTSQCTGRKIALFLAIQRARRCSAFLSWVAEPPL